MLPRVNGERIDCKLLETSVGNIYYGRGAVTGDWYIGLTEGSAEQRRSVVKQAKVQGEPVVPHPEGGVRMVRFDWLFKILTPLDRKALAVIKGMMESFPPYVSSADHGPNQ